MKRKTVRRHRWQWEGDGLPRKPLACLNCCGWSKHYERHHPASRWRRLNRHDLIEHAVYTHTDGRRVVDPRRVGEEVPCVTQEEARS